jgi:ABC-type Fe3+-siderophore transport system permease subunit
MLSLLYVILSGIALPVGGIQMQYLWRNQLGDVYSLGLGSAACLGAAAATMSGWCSLTVGSFICTLICTLICFFVTLKISTQNLITFGIIFGTFIGSLGTIVVTNAPNGDLLKQYYLWGAANFRLEGVTTGDIIFSLCLFAGGLAAAIWSSKRLTRHFRGEIEISNLGKALSLLMIMFLVTSAVSICGPIGFISLGVPNLSRTICRKTDIRYHYLISSAMGIGLLLITYLVVEYVSFGIYLPISATMAIIALPLTALLFIKGANRTTE